MQYIPARVAKTTKAILSGTPLGGVTPWVVPGQKRMMGSPLRGRVILPNCQYCLMILLSENL